MYTCTAGVRKPLPTSEGRIPVKGATRTRRASFLPRPTLVAAAPSCWPSKATRWTQRKSAATAAPCRFTLGIAGRAMPARAKARQHILPAVSFRHAPPLPHTGPAHLSHGAFADFIGRTSSRARGKGGGRAIPYTRRSSWDATDTGNGRTARAARPSTGVRTEHRIFSNLTEAAACCAPTLLGLIRLCF